MVKHQAAGLVLRQRTSVSWLVGGLVALILLALVEEAWAKHGGGRAGGGAGFRRAERRFTEFPRSGRSPARFRRPRYYEPTGIPRGFPVVIPLPVGGFGGGGLTAGPLVGLLVVLMGGFILYVVVNDLRSRWGGLGAVWQKRGGTGYLRVMKLHLGLFATARFIQEDLARIAREAESGTPEGLAALLAEASVSLGRRPEFWKYAAWQVWRASSLEEAEEKFREVIGEERIKLSEERIVNVDGVRREIGETNNAGPGEVGAYLVVSVIAAASRPVFDAVPAPTQADIERILRKLGSLSATALLGVEIIWAPERSSEALTEEELIEKYPELQPL